MQGLPADSLFLLFREFIRYGQVFQISGLVHLGQLKQIGRLLSVLLDHRIQAIFQDEGRDALLVQFFGHIHSFSRIREHAEATARDYQYGCSVRILCREDLQGGILDIEKDLVPQIHFRHADVTITRGVLLVEPDDFFLRKHFARGAAGR